MKFKRKDIVGQSGCISYLIKVKFVFFWLNYATFKTREARDLYYENLLIEANL